MSDVQIKDIISGCKRGDKSSFSLLVEMYSHRLYGFYIHMGYSHDIAEDLVQELFIKLVDKIQKYNDWGQFDAWLFRVAANLARDFSRKKKISTISINMTSDGDQEDLLISDPSQKSPDSNMEAMETREEINKALQQLSEQEREFILMRHYGQMSFKDIASETGVPVGTILSKVHRGLKKLRELLS